MERVYLDTLDYIMLPMIIKSIDLNNVNLDIYSGPVGLMLSGGADSSILLYNLLKHKTDDKVIVFTTGNNLKSRYNVLAANAIVEKCIQLTNNSNLEHYITYCEVQNSETLFSRPEFYLKHKLVGIVYTGITQNPPIEISRNFLMKTTETIRNPDQGDQPFLADNNTLYRPWINENKKKIAELYKNDNLINILFPLTRSCEYNPKHNFFTNIVDPGFDHCGKCWWCQERQWAFGKLK
jgi:7-cyano-7-deazaguanine synthase in queuosine biosynthesis